MLGVVEAMERVLARLSPRGADRVPLADACGRVLADDVVATLSLPPWDNAAMDGYATIAADVRGASSLAPVRLRVSELIAAGQTPQRAISRGHAARIMTGAPMPSGADSVVRIEDTDGGTDTVEIRSDRDAGRNVRPRGEDVRDHERVLAGGTLLAPSAVAMLAALGVEHVQVTRRPRVAILGSGDELVPVERFADVRAGRAIVASNGYGLVALVRDAGGEPVDLGTTRDTPDALRSGLARAEGMDLVVTTGGISIGAHDHTRDVVQRVGALEFWGVRMRPGAQLAFGRVGDAPWLGLPGNPVSAMVTAELFVRPAVRRLQGVRAAHRLPVHVELAEPVTTPGTMTYFLRAFVTHEGRGRIARLTGAQGSGMLSSMSRANALLVVPEGMSRAEPGAILSAIPLGPAEMCDRASISAPAR